MTKNIYLNTLWIIVLVVSTCKNCPTNNEATYNVDQTNLPSIIPYNDLSRVSFLKNDTDTLTFISLGLKNVYIHCSEGNGNCSFLYRVQQFSVKMFSNPKNHFEIQYGTERGFKQIGINVNVNGVDFSETTNSSFVRYFPPVLSYTVLNVSYDSITLLTSKYNDTAYFKPKYGFIYFNIRGDRYQLIK